MIANPFSPPNPPPCGKNFCKRMQERAGRGLSESACSNHMDSHIDLTRVKPAEKVVMLDSLYLTLGFHDAHFHEDYVVYG